MKSVSCRAVARFAAKARACGIDSRNLFEGLSHSPEHFLDHRNYVHWDEFCGFAERLQEIAGGAQALKDVCMAETGSRFEHFIGVLLSWYVSPRWVYRFAARMFSRLFPCLGIETTEAWPNRLTIRVCIPEDLRDCRAALMLPVGCFRALPRWIGHPDAEVEAQFRDRAAEYRVKLPPSRSFLARVQRSWSIFFSGRVAVDILRRQAEELNASYDQLNQTRQQLERELATASNTAQKRLAAGLENRLGSVLGRIAFRAKCLEEKLEPVSATAHAEASSIRALLEDAVSMTRDLAHGLDPIGRDGTLEEALRNVASHIRSLCGVSCEFNRIGKPWEFDHAASLNLYRFCQEAINNAIRHGSARHIRILMASADDVCSLTVTDDGIGIRSDLKNTAGRGTKIMQYRAAMLDGTLRIQSTPGEGTAVSCIVKTSKLQAEEESIARPASANDTQRSEAAA